jgi:hypothetical protein
LAEPSDDVIDSAEEVVCLENEVQSLGLRRQKEEQLDWFREREEREAERQAQRQEADRKHQAQLAADQRRQKWKTEWLEYALNSIPSDAPRSVRLDLHECVERVLQRLDPMQPDSTVLRLVDAAVDQALTPWRTAKQISGAIKNACEDYTVPYDMRRDSAWEARMYQAASTAVGRLRGGASLAEVETAASHASALLVREFEQGKACAEIVRNLWARLPEANSDEREQGKEAVQEALAKLPIGASKRDIEKARDGALEPICKAIAARQDRQTRDSLLGWIGIKYKFVRLSHEQQQKARKEIGEALNRLPPGTPKAALEQAIDNVIERHSRIHDDEEAEKKKRRDAEYKASQYLNHIETYLQEEYEFDGGYFEMRKEVDRLREPIRQALVNELLEDSKMDAEDIRGRIEELVDDDL